MKENSGENLKLMPENILIRFLNPLFLKILFQGRIK